MHEKTQSAKCVVNIILFDQNLTSFTMKFDINVIQIIVLVIACKMAMIYNKQM